MASHEWTIHANGIELHEEIVTEKSEGLFTMRHTRRIDRQTLTIIYTKTVDKEEISGASYPTRVETKMTEAEIKEFHDTWSRYGQIVQL